MYLLGRGGDKNFFKANEFFAKGCDLKDGSSCYQLASSFCEGKGVRQDYLKAVEYYAESCDYGNENGCTLYANRNNLNCER
jgi:TPR repeat protein